MEESEANVLLLHWTQTAQTGVFVSEKMLNCKLEAAKLGSFQILSGRNDILREAINQSR